jgi:hypothetical protein
MDAIFFLTHEQQRSPCDTINTFRFFENLQLCYR